MTNFYLGHIVSLKSLACAGAKCSARLSHRYPVRHNPFSSFQQRMWDRESGGMWGWGRRKEGWARRHRWWNQGKTPSALYWAVFCLSELALVLLSLRLHAGHERHQKDRLKKGGIAWQQSVWTFWLRSTNVNRDFAVNQCCKSHYLHVYSWSSCKWTPVRARDLKTAECDAKFTAPGVLLATEAYAS